MIVSKPALVLVVILSSPTPPTPPNGRQPVAKAKAAAEVYAAQITLADIEMHTAGSKALEAAEDAQMAYRRAAARAKGPEWQELRSRVEVACSNFPAYIEINPRTSRCLGLSGRALDECVSDESDRVNFRFNAAIAACQAAKQEISKFTQMVSQEPEPYHVASESAHARARDAVEKFLSLCRAAAGAYGIAGMKAEKRYYECVIALVDGISAKGLADQDEISKWPTMICASNGGATAGSSKQKVSSGSGPSPAQSTSPAGVPSPAKTGARARPDKRSGITGLGGSPGTPAPSPP